MIVVRRPDADFMAAFMFFCESVSSNKKKEKRKKFSPQQRQLTKCRVLNTRRPFRKPISIFPRQIKPLPHFHEAPPYDFMTPNTGFWRNNDLGAKFGTKDGSARSSLPVHCVEILARIQSEEQRTEIFSKVVTAIPI